MERSKFQACANVLSLTICIHPALEIRVTGTLLASLKPLLSDCLSGVKEEGTLEDSPGVMKTGDWAGLRHDPWA